MKKKIISKKIISMLLALTLAVTGSPFDMPIDTAYAAEADAFNYDFKVAENGKAVGSDGIAYDDVAYLSAKTVNALDVNAQREYFAFCDDVAAARNAGDDLDDIVAAIDEAGTLVFYYTIPMQEILPVMDELAKDFLENAMTVQEDETEEARQQETETVENECKTDVLSTEEAAAEEETTAAEIREIETEAVTEEEPEAVTEEETEAVMEEKAEAVMETETESVMEKGTEAVTEEEAEAAAEEEAEAIAKDETEAVTEEFVLTAENMELIPELEEERFDAIEEVKADVIVDLGYNGSDLQQIYSILPKTEWFSEQLTTDQQKIYNACRGMGKGTNRFQFSYSSRLYGDNRDLLQAISAYIMTEPYQCDWMDLSPLTGGLSIKAYAYSESDPTYDYEIIVSKSRYYSNALNKEADAKVLELAAQAQGYAVQNYPDSPVYGIVKYFDKWICENNYYNYDGVYGGMDKSMQEAYYLCHSSYGILLKGYGVCESYALAMTRCLDALGIPNMYATGQAVQGNQSGGHAWNYIQMPDGNWYLHDSTWNDSEAAGTSTEQYLLCGEDSAHIPMGNRYKNHTGAFQFVERSFSAYMPINEKLALSKTEINLLPKKTEELACDSTYIANENIPKVWSSSNEKVAKVDANGKVTAVGAGSAEITLTAAGMSAACMVNVHQIDSITFVNGKKASLTTSCGIESGSSIREIQHIFATVNQKAENPAYTAEELNQKGVFDDFAVKSSNEGVAAVSCTLTENMVDLAIKPVSKGKTTITVVFGAKKAVLNLSVSEKLNEGWFDLTAVKALQANTELMYTGKAYKPKVSVTSAGKEKKVKFKVSYFNTKDAGTASVVITGKGIYGGELRYDFTINPLELRVDTGSIKASEKSIYNGGVNLTKSTVKHIDESGIKPKQVSLKAGKDYDIEYTNIKTKETTTQPTEAGEYTMAVVGKGNYAGGANKPVPIAGKTWKIEQNNIKKVKVTVKVNGVTPTVMAAIGKNELQETDYKMAFYADKECTKEVNPSHLVAKRQYYVKIEAAGSNITMDAKSKPIIKSFKTK